MGRGHLILDPLSGSSTTGVACLRTGRRYLGLELDPASAAVARERLEAESNLSTLDAQRQHQATLFTREP